MDCLKIKRILILLMLLTVAGLSFTGCVEMSLNTKIKSNGSCRESFQVSASSIFAEGVKGEIEKQDLKKDGYAIDTKTEGDKFIVTISRDFSSVADMYAAKRINPISSITGSNNGSDIKYEYKVDDLFFVRTITFKEMTPAINTRDGKKGDQTERQIEVLGKQFAQSMLTFKRTIEMPGSIISSNADEIDRKLNKATWTVPFSRIQGGCSFEIESRVINYSLITITSIGLFIIVILIVIAMTGKKKTSEEVE